MLWQTRKTQTLQNFLHKRQLHIIKQINGKVIKILIIMEANKGITVVIIDKDAYQQKVKTFVQENNFIKIYKNSTGVY